MFMILAKMTPDAVAMENATDPRRKIPRDLTVKKTSAWVLAPTVNPRKIVAVSIMEELAVLAKRSTTRDSFMKLPKKKGPSSGMDAGARKQHKMTPTIGKQRSSLRVIGRSVSGILINRSFLVVRSRIIGG